MCYSLQHLFIHLLNKYVLTTHYVPGTILGMDNGTENKAGTIPILVELTF